MKKYYFIKSHPTINKDEKAIGKTNERIIWWLIMQMYVTPHDYITRKCRHGGRERDSM